jgi:prepilin-type N-terminal cleavage/methylation domain-containing protein
MRKKGFTLIELLVVIAIIALVLSILLPALKSAKIQAQGAVCVSNLSGLLKAYHAYTLENDEKLVNGNVPCWPGQQGLDISNAGKDYWVQPPMTENWLYWGEPTDPPPTLAQKQLGIMRGALFPYADNVKAYHCPGDLSRKLVPNVDNPFPENYSYRSYSIQELMNGWRNDPERITKFTEIVSPGYKYVFLGTAEGRGWNIGSWTFYYDQTPPWSDTIAVWHRDRSGIGYADGHGELHKWEDEYIINAANDPDVTWFESSDPDSEDLRFLKRGFVPGIYHASE